MTIPARPTARTVLGDYGRLGVRHILSGPDHLLFVFGLVLLGGTLRRVAGTVTAFTLGHSVTLSLAALGLADVPAAPVEVLIALSVWVLALEVARPPARRGAIARWPWIAAGGFGLLHGLGFAAALREAGLPSGDVPLALVGFNGGVELGQLAFVVAVLAVLAAGRRLPLPAPGWLRAAPVTAMGALATYWCLERVAVLVG
ncbi:MAG: HupE/UreJ family protein [bacterium]|nr:HupE/UreJ family protein [bacterium]